MVSVAPFAPLLVIGVLTLLSFASFSRYQRGLLSSVGQLAAIPALGNGCYHVYLDLGTNTGIQLRKLYEPDRYPNNGIEHRFLQYFGPISSTEPAQLAVERQRNETRRNTCAFGWEPNPHHAAYLTNFTTVYQAAGYRLYISAETAVGTRNGTVEFKSDNDVNNAEWASQVKSITANGTNSTASNSSGMVTAQLIDFGEWLERHIVNRRIPFAPPGSLPPAVVMKVDIEGDDPALFGHLIRSALLCHVDYAYVEHLSDEQVAAINGAFKLAQCPTTVERIDDESFHTARLPFDPR